MNSNNTNKKVYVVDGSRTPFLKARGKPGLFSASDLSIGAARPLLSRLPISPQDLDEVIIGCVMPSPDEANIARMIALRLGCGKHMPAWTVQRNCASGMQALDCAFLNILSGRSDLVLAGGVEAMSHAPLLLNQTMVNWMGDLQSSRGWFQRLKTIFRLRPGHFKPVIALLHGLSDPIVNLSMGQTAEILAYKFGLTREEIDTFSLTSHNRLAKAQDENLLPEVEPIYDSHGKFFDKDNGLRRGTTLEQLGRLKPVFDRGDGVVTAGNSAQITDGAAMLILASEEAVQKHKLPVLGRIVDCHWAGLEPSHMGLGPVHSVVPLLKSQNIEPESIDFWEINEAFSSQVLACLAAWKDEKYCQEELGLEKAFGEIDRERLNVDGGSICIGHPIGATGSRIVLHLLHVLKRNKKKRGVATLCIGGGQGGAMLVESEGE